MLRLVEARRVSTYSQRQLISKSKMTADTLIQVLFMIIWIENFLLAWAWDYIATGCMSMCEATQHDGPEAEGRVHELALAGRQRRLEQGEVGPIDEAVRVEKHEPFHGSESSVGSAQGWVGTPAGQPDEQEQGATSDGKGDPEHQQHGLDVETIVGALDSGEDIVGRRLRVLLAAGVGGVGGVALGGELISRRTRVDRIPALREDLSERRQLWRLGLIRRRAGVLLDHDLSVFVEGESVVVPPCNNLEHLAAILIQGNNIRFFISVTIKVPPTVALINSVHILYYGI